MLIDHSKKVKQQINAAAIRWLFEACQLVRGQAVLLVSEQSGQLKRSLTYQVDPGELVGYVGTAAAYAVYIEFGTGEFAENGQGRKGGWVYQDPSGAFFFTWGQPPQPYLRTAFRTCRLDIENLARKILGDISG